MKSQPSKSVLQCAIRRAMKEAQITPYRLAIMCGIRPPNIYRMLRNPIDGRHLERMLAALGAIVRIGGLAVKLGLIHGDVKGRWRNNATRRFSESRSGTAD